jgi:muramoyltetrapeptide carboxypeptidase
MERLKPALALLQKRYRLLVSDDIDRKEGFLAGDDARRANEMNAALTNPDVRCIWAARGGYGCSRIVSQLDANAFRADPVPIVGFSDVTVLLCWAASLGYQSIHAPVVTQFGELGADDQKWLLSVLEGNEQVEIASGLLGPEVEGRLVGGNLSLLAHLCGTALAPNYEGALCVLEDVGERPYAVDRYLQQLLSQEHGLRLASGVLLGDFHECVGPIPQDALAVAATQIERAGVACVKGLPIGHGTQNRAFRFGGLARVEGGRLLRE